MATANPTQLYERVSQAEALSRNAHLNGQIFYQEEALSRNDRHRLQCRPYRPYRVKSTWRTRTVGELPLEIGERYI